MIKNKSDLLKISIEEAFKLGEKNFLDGKSIHYNPYRNFNLVANIKIAELNNAWVDGYEYKIKN